MEDSGITDSATGKKIRVSISVRKIYRDVEEYAGIRNAKLNQIIATDFSRESSNVLHHFRLTKMTPKAVGEIRGSSSIYYISAIRDGYIDILTVKGSWLEVEPKKRITDYTKLSLED